ncbi:MAG: hypothetical protein HQK96_11815 [Nitrospirae bacterium]|nr:hypothetical protein [Nitrospirota bacterium]
MPTTLPIEIYDLLEKKVGKEEAREVGKILTASFNAIEKKAEAVVIQKKAEIKEELTKELATKEDLAKLEGRLNERITSLEGRLNERITSLEGRLNERITSLEGKINERFTAADWKMRVYFLILIFVILLTNPRSLDLIAKVLGLLR